MRKLLCISLLAVLAVVQSHAAEGKMSQLTDGQLQRIRKTKLHFLVPTYIPAGFKLAKFDLHLDKNPMLIDLNLSYRKGKAEFTLQQTSEGIGDVFLTLPDGDTVEPQHYLKFNNPVFGKGSVGYYVGKGKKLWCVNWIEMPGKTYPRFVSTIGSNVDAREGAKLMASLRSSR